MQKDVVLSKAEYETLESKKVAVIGCGGLGGHVLEMLARLGVGEIVIVDDNVFSEKNLNRQVILNQASIGKYKVSEAVRWIKQVNPFVYVKGIIDRLDKDNADKIIKGVDIVMDCVDHVETKFILQSTCEKLDIPLIHGQVEGWKGQVSTIFPKDKTLDKIYGDIEIKNKDIKKASIIPAVAASYQVAECVKVWLGKGDVLRHKVMYIDIFKNESIVKDLK